MCAKNLIIGCPCGEKENRNAKIMWNYGVEIHGVLHGVLK